MRSAFFPARRLPSHRVYILCSCITGLAVGSWKVRGANLSAESGNQEQWPKSRPLITSSSNRLRSSHEESGGFAKEFKPQNSNTQGRVNGKDEDVPLSEDDESAAWASFSTRFATVKDSLTSIQWSVYRDKIADQVLPEWALALPNYVAKLQMEIEMGPNSLAYKIWVRSSPSHPIASVSGYLKLEPWNNCKANSLFRRFEIDTRCNPP